MSPFSPIPHIEPLCTRRDFLARGGMGFGALSLAGLLGEGLFGDNAAAAEAGNSLVRRAPPFRAKAKLVVHIFAQGARAHVDSWDPIPALRQ